MTRSKWKGPYVARSLLKKVLASKCDQLKVYSRASTILPNFVGNTFLVYNGKKFIPVHVTEEMIGHKLGEFSPTRVLPSHSVSSKSRNKASKK